MFEVEQADFITKIRHEEIEAKRRLKQQVKTTQSYDLSMLGATVLTIIWVAAMYIILFGSLK